MVKALESAGRAAYNMVEELGRSMLFLYSLAKAVRRDRFRWRQTFDAMLEIGVRSSFVVFLTATFTGLVFALQTSYAFGLFRAEALIGSSVTLSLTRELAPVLTALMVIGRAGSAMTSEIGTMRVTEQIDALQTMAVPPLSYLVVPRVVATTITMPLLTILFDFVGFWAAWFVTIRIVSANPAAVTEQIRDHVDLLDLYSGVIKAAVFGFIVAVVCTSHGYAASGGSKGVGQATTRAVVAASIAVLVADYFLTVLIFGS